LGPRNPMMGRGRLDLRPPATYVDLPPPPWRPQVEPPPYLTILTCAPQQLLIEVDDVGSQFLDFMEIEDRPGHVISHGDHDGVTRQRGKGGGDEVAKHSVAALSGVSVDDRAGQKDQGRTGQGQPRDTSRRGRVHPQPPEETGPAESRSQGHEKV